MDPQPQTPTASVLEAIANAKRELQQMMDLNPQAIVLLDAGGGWARTTRALLEFAGLERFEDALGQPLASIFRPAEGGFFERLLAAHTGFSAEDASVTLTGGEQREVRFTLVGAPGPAGQLVTLIEDVTGERERHAHFELQCKQQAVTALIGGLMHNINQPLTVIMVTARLMQVAIESPAPDADEIRRHLATVSEQAMQIRTMLEAVRSARDYITERYTDGSEILDIPGLTREAP